MLRRVVRSTPLCIREEVVSSIIPHCLLHDCENGYSLIPSALTFPLTFPVGIILPVVLVSCEMILVPVYMCTYVYACTLLK